MGPNESQISPIPPERYGDRFVKFISGVTKTRERAEAERLSQSIDHATGIGIPKGIEGTLDDPHLAGVNIQKSRIDPAGTDVVMEKAQRQAERSRLCGANEKEVSDRSLSAVRSPGPADGPDAVMLPVIGEAAESGSQQSRTPSRITPKQSYEDVRSQRPVLGNANMTSDSLGEVPPPTPPKMDGEFDGKRESWAGEPPPTPPKDERSRGRTGLDKELPPPPPASSAQLSASPARASEETLKDARSRRI